MLTLILFCYFTCTLSGAQNFRTLSIDKSINYKIEDENKTFELGRDTYKTKSDVHIISSTDPQLFIMPLARCRVVKDTLEITLEAINEAIYSRCTIRIAGNKYHISYQFKESGEAKLREIIADSFELTLNHKNLEKGQTIKGHTEFSGRCKTDYCPEYVKNLVIKGNFSVTIE